MNMQKRVFNLAFLILLLIPCFLTAQNYSWRPGAGPLTTVWTNKVTPANVHNEYPRPQMVREKWRNLNGLWSYQITSAIENYELVNKQASESQILVPFSIESDLSGVKKKLLPEQQLWYHRTFSIPASWKGQRVLLHFGAVDWKTNVWVNGKKIGTHQGGYEPFTFDITTALQENGEQKITVSVWDPSDEGFQPVGKQTLNPRGIWYTSTSGIWQTVWLEPVPQTAIARLKMIPDIDKKILQLKVNSNSASSEYYVNATVYDKGKKVTEAKGKLGQNLVIHLENMKMWSPDNPFLYDLTVSLFKGSKKIDEVKTYFGMRKISLGKDDQGITRLFLNNKPLFQFGPLDQGFWPDGIYTAPTDEAMKFDIE